MEKVTRTPMPGETVAPRPSPPHRRFGLTALRLAAAVALLFWVMRDSNVGEVFSIIRSAKGSLLALALALNFLGYYIVAYRWRALLSAQGVNAPLRFLIESYAVSVFFNNLLPSTIGGDSVRAYDTWRAGKKHIGAVTAVLVDRLLGMLALALVAVVALFLSAKLRANIPFLYLWVLLGALCVLAATLVVLIPAGTMGLTRARVLFFFSKRAQRVYDKVTGSFAAFHGRRDVLAKALALSLVLQGNVVVYYYLIGVALGFAVPFHAFLLVVPVATIVMAIPISINGIGLRESTFAFLLATYGVSKPEAIALAWLAYGAGLLQAVLGGVLFALRATRHPGDVRPAALDARPALLAAHVEHERGWRDGTG